MVFNYGGVDTMVVPRGIMKTKHKRIWQTYFLAMNYLLITPPVALAVDGAGDGGADADGEKVNEAVTDDEDYEVADGDGTVNEAVVDDRDDEVLHDDGEVNDGVVTDKDKS